MATAKKSKSRLTAKKFIEVNPTAKAGDIAKLFGISRAYVYVVRSRLKKMNNKSDKSEGLNMDAIHKVRPHEDVTTLAHDPKHDVINHPPHYKVGGVETIDFIEAKGLGYNLGNVVKYISRADHKNTRKENLEKARWYLEREISRCA